MLHGSPWVYTYSHCSPNDHPTRRKGLQGLSEVARNCDFSTCLHEDFSLNITLLSSGHCCQECYSKSNHGMVTDCCLYH